MAYQEIMRFRYRIIGERSHEVIATEKICKRKMKELLEEHNGNVKVSRIVVASAYPTGAPHV